MGQSGTNSEVSQLAESARILELLLQFIDPTKEPPPLIWEHVEGLVDAADKYQINGIVPWFERAVEREAFTFKRIGNPVVCFELADRFKLRNIINMTTRDLIRSSTTDLTFKPTVDARLLSRMYRFRAARTSALVAKLLTIEKYTMEQNGYCSTHGDIDPSPWISELVQEAILTPSWEHIKGWIEMQGQWGECPCEWPEVPPTLEREMQDLESESPILWVTGQSD